MRGPVKPVHVVEQMGGELVTGDNQVGLPGRHRIGQFVGDFITLEDIAFADKIGQCQIAARGAEGRHVKTGRQEVRWQARDAPPVWSDGHGEDPETSRCGLPRTRGKPPQVTQHPLQVIGRAAGSWQQLGCPAIAWDGCGLVAKPLQRAPPIVMNPMTGRIGGQRLVKKRESLFQALVAHQERSETSQGVGMIGKRSQDFAIDGFGGGPLPRALTVLSAVQDPRKREETHFPNGHDDLLQGARAARRVTIRASMPSPASITGAPNMSVPGSWRPGPISIPPSAFTNAPAFRWRRRRSMSAS